jgi:hypothetical protein
MSMGDAALLPRMKALEAKPELLAEERSAYRIDQLGMGMKFCGHAPLYQRCVDIASPDVLIAISLALMQCDGVSFGDKLRSAIRAAGFKSPRRFAIDGMGWPESSGPQRLDNYLKGRIPDVPTVMAMASALNVSLGTLLSEATDDALRDILSSLLALEGIPEDKADTIANVAIVAKALLETLPDETPLPARARLAAHAAWRTQQPLSPGM